MQEPQRKSRSARAAAQELQHKSRKSTPGVDLG